MTLYIWHFTMYKYVMSSNRQSSLTKFVNYYSLTTLTLLLKWLNQELLIQRILPTVIYRKYNDVVTENIVQVKCSTFYIVSFKLIMQGLNMFQKRNPVYALNVLFLFDVVFLYDYQCILFLFFYFF